MKGCGNRQNWTSAHFSLSTLGDFTSMTLREIISDLDGTDNSMAICVADTADWAATSAAALFPADRIPKGIGFTYFLEVSVAKNVLRAWSFVRAGRKPDISEACAAIIYYAQNDAYLLPS